MIKVSDIEAHMKKAQHGYSLSFGVKSIEATKLVQGMKYSCWSGELIDVVQPNKVRYVASSLHRVCGMRGFS